VKYTLPKIDSVPVKKKLPKQPVARKNDMVIVDTATRDSSGPNIVKPDTSTPMIPQITELPEDPCTADTSALWIYPDPSGGLHRNAVSVSFGANKACSIRYRFNKNGEWINYGGTPFRIDQTATLQYEAVDSCGRNMEMRAEFYEIELSNALSPCTSGMEHVKVGSVELCIDRYEWPNKRGVKPQAYISLYQAMDSCYSRGKRLCTSEEWSIACTGPYSWKYPYGQAYERYACATNDTSVAFSGSRPECRGYFAVYDMSGSLLEWTSTKSSENRQFYNVMGGFWESGSQSGCFDKRYSYYPENKHNPVGFRCCSDVPAQGETSGDKSRKRSN
jgi:hypothetical protein